MKIKNCPFCGGEARKLCDLIEEIYFVMCLECRTESRAYDSLEEAIEAWNRREPIDKIVEQLEDCKIKKYVSGITHNPYEFGACHAMDDAIEVVKKGGNV